MTSLRRTLTVRTVILLMIVGIAAAITAYFFVRYEVNEFLDNQLREVALNAGFDFRHDADPRIEVELEDQLVVQVWDHDGQLIHRSGPVAALPEQSKVGYADVATDGEGWRIFRLRDAQHAVQISQRWSARDEVAAHAAAGAIVPLVIAVPVAWLLIGWTIQRVLAGLGGLSADIGRRSADSRDELGLAGVPAEIIPLVTAMNSLIARHQHAVEVQRRFVADAAHELRTPLAALQIQIDNLQTHHDAGSMRETARELLGGVRRATYSVNQLLTMTRADASMPIDPIRMDSAVLLDLAASMFVPIARAKSVDLLIDSAESVHLTIRASDMQLLLSNLLDNAVRYTATGGQVQLSGKRSGNIFAIAITDTGCGIPDAALPLIYDRFFRAAPSEIEGTGLGLAICRTVADRNGIGLSVRNRADARGVIAEISIPLTDALERGKKQTATPATPALILPPGTEPRHC